jgi:hypothetical protein
VGRRRDHAKFFTARDVFHTAGVSIVRSERAQATHGKK